LEFITTIWYILGPFGNLVVRWDILPHFGILYQEKSGNPGSKKGKTKRLQIQVGPAKCWLNRKPIFKAFCFDLPINQQSFVSSNQESKHRQLLTYNIGTG
jgi:hypothetical protein